MTDFLKAYSKRKSPSKELEELRTKAATVSVLIDRLEAEAGLHYPANHPVLVAQRKYYRELREINKHNTIYFQKAQDYWDETSVNGGLALLELERRKANCEKRIEDIKAQSKIVYLDDYRAKKIAEQQEPKGA